MKQILAYLRPHFSRVTIGMIIKFIGSIMDLLLPWILAHMIDNIVPTRDIQQIFLWGGAMLICAAVALITNIVANRMASRVARDATQAIRHDLFRRVCYLSCRQTDHFTIPSLISRLSSDTYNIHQMFGMMQRMGIRAPILLIGGIGVTLTLEPVLALVLIAVLPFILMVTIFVSKKGIPLFTHLQRGIDQMVRSVREGFTGIRVIKALSKTEYEKQQFDLVNQEVSTREKRAGMTMALTNPSMNLLLNLGLTLVIIVGAFRVNAGISQPGKIIAFMSYFTLILNALLAVNRIFTLLSKATASAKRINEVVNTEEDLVQFPPDHIENGLHLSVEQVGFSYQSQKQDSAVQVLSDISFGLKRGETLGIIGATGCGKTTLIQLIMRFYDVDSGVIRIDGTDIRSMSTQELHSKFGVVFQNDFLFSESVQENISFGRGLELEEVRKAAHSAQASEFIESLEDGYSHILATRGSNFSGGQKQRILIARALANHPEFLILDDSSSALDYRTDAALRREIGKTLQDTTTIIVAQRISSVRNADHILVLDHGKVIGYGTDQELMQSCEIYREIADSQMGEMPQ